MNFPLFSFIRHSIDALCQAVKRRLHHWTKPDNHMPVLNTVLYPVLVGPCPGRTRPGQNQGAALET